MDQNSFNQNDLKTVPVRFTTSALGKLGVFGVGQTNGLLKWSKSSGKVWLEDEAGSVHFSMHFSEVQKIQWDLNMLTINVQNKKYVMFMRSTVGDISYGAGVATGASAGPSILAGTVQAHQSGLSELVELIKLNGGSAVKSSPLKAAGIGILVGIILLVAFVAIILVFGSSSSN